MQQTYHPLIVLDESGDPGMKKGQSSARFTLVAVMFERNDQAAECEEVIARVRSEHGLPAGFEFHFIHLAHSLKVAFLEAVSACPFLFAACTVQKETLYDVRAWGKNPYFYDQVITPIVAGLEEYLHIARATKGQALNARVHADDSGNPAFREALKAGFAKVKDVDGRSLVEKVRFSNSRSWSLIQLADMVCGAVAQLQGGDDAYHRVIRSRQVLSATLP